MSLWGVMISWFTPTTLFLFLNFTIATIYVTSGFKPPPRRTLNKFDSPPQTEELQRTTSVLQRLKSVNFYQYASYYRPYDSAAPVAQTAPPSHTLNKPESPPQTEELERTTSVLQRLRSVNFYQYASYYRPHDSAAPVADTAPPGTAAEDEPVVVNPSYEAEDRFDDEEKEDEHEDSSRSLDEVYSQLQRGSHHRSKSDMEPASGAVAVKLVKKIKKSASSKSAFRHFKEADILEARRPATVKESKPSASEDAEVDSKADDFINKFKQQLHLQRLGSILRYKEMLGRGA